MPKLNPNFSVWCFNPSSILCRIASILSASKPFLQIIHKSRTYKLYKSNSYHLFTSINLFTHNHKQNTKYDTDKMWYTERKRIRWQVLYKLCHLTDSTYNVCKQLTRWRCQTLLPQSPSLCPRRWSLCVASRQKTLTLAWNHCTWTAHSALHIEV